jgi:tryptophanyl-tRNA synthetase
MNSLLADIHIRREDLKNKPAYVREVLEYGAERAKKVAAANMEEIRAAMNVL